MSDPSLLAVTLLATGQVSPPPPLPENPLSNFLSAFDVSDASASLSLVQQQTIPSTEQSQPEFSSSRSQILMKPQLNSSQSSLSLPPEVNPTSGSQLYQLRLAALKAGKLYTRLSGNSFYSTWAGATKQPTHQQWKQLLGQEARALSNGQGSNRLGVLVGDSLSLWFPSQLLPGGKLWLNQGISGENSTQILQRVSTFAQTNPETIYVMAGINDLRQGANNWTILNNTRLIVRRIKQNHPQAEVVVQSILPTRLEAIPNSRILYLNQQVRDIAQQEGANHLDLHPYFTDSQGQMRRDLTTDGIHLSSQGYRVWQSVLSDVEYTVASRRYSNSFVN
ncbi:MAG: GDSL-type esterase/lipase family protein [Spirulinaceae cyanobacterium]